jgi:hypothetical protein
MRFRNSIGRIGLSLFVMTVTLPALVSAQRPDDRRDRPAVPTDPQDVIPPPPLDDPAPQDRSPDRRPDVQDDRRPDRQTPDGGRRDREDAQRRPQTMLVPPRDQGSHWRLGVYADNSRTGVRITQVVPGSPAWREGLERGDIIVTVSGFQVGYVDGRLFDLGTELQYRADRSGRVLLLVQNHRDGRLVNLQVQLEPRNVRPFAQPESDQATRR